MRLVIADTGPLNYLILIGQIDLLPGLFEKVVLPTTVQSELASSKAPPLVSMRPASAPGLPALSRRPGSSRRLRVAAMDRAGRE